MSRAYYAIGVQTEDQLRQTRRRRDRHLREVTRALEAMRSGAALRCCFQRGRAIWFLSTGPFVAADVAATLIARPDIIAVDVGLFPGATPQSWRYIDGREQA